MGEAVADRDREGLLLALEREAGRLGAARHRHRRAVAGQLGLGPSDIEGLDAVLGEGPLTPGQIAMAMGLTTGAVTGLVDRLESAGYVRRERDPIDRRKILVRINPAKARRLQGFQDRLLEACGSEFAGRSHEEIAAALDIIGSLGRALDHAASALRDRPPTRVAPRRRGRGGDPPPATG